ncbi:hypothetical protein TA3x_005234 [Tundrisphaera sp. TA3]|uniref:hypothetical protein n=1 Tax=Tundrisphaera sp. TA3 TaxID=3435775 RepID=UPI003EB719FA
MGRPLNRHDLRDAYAAAEALGINQPEPRRARSEPSDRKPKVDATTRTRVVWAVCDVGGRTVATFHYSEKPAAEARAAELKSKGKGMHFVRSIKETIGD